MTRHDAAKRRIIVKKNSTKWMLAVGTAALSTLFAPSANAGCGKELVSKLSVLLPGDQSPARATEIEKTAEAIGTQTVPQTAPQTIPGVGMWAVNVTFGGQVIYQAFESFTGDGLEFLNDNGSTLEGNVCFGVWTAPSRNTIKVYHPAWNYDMGGNLIGTVVIKSQMTIDPSGNTFKGTVVIYTYDLNGKEVAPELPAQISGQRITVK
jgi:hypothetical protein